MLISASKDKTIKFWKLKNGTLEEDDTKNDHGKYNSDYLIEETEFMDQRSGQDFKPKDKKISSQMYRESSSNSDLQRDDPLTVVKPQKTVVKKEQPKNVEEKKLEKKEDPESEDDDLAGWND